MQPVISSNGSKQSTFLRGNFIMQSLGNQQATASVILGPAGLKSTVLKIEFFFRKLRRRR
jgi:hypothetical protein